MRPMQAAGCSLFGLGKGNSDTGYDADEPGGHIAPGEVSQSRKDERFDSTARAPRVVRRRQMGSRTAVAVAGHRARGSVRWGRSFSLGKTRTLRRQCQRPHFNMGEMENSMSCIFC